MKLLWEATRDLHHACEAHPVGAAMASGKPPKEWYAQWLSALLQIHKVIDNTVPVTVQRCDSIESDIVAMGYDIPPINQAAAKYVEALTSEIAIAGAAYVLTGAHLMGGEIMRRRLEGFPTRHLEWEDRKAALAELSIMRSREDIVEPARECFNALLSIMDEIQAK